MTGGGAKDRGQAFPIYIVVVVGLLFAALAFFVVGMAGAKRSDAQGAADAAALAAAREARDKALVGLDLGVLTSVEWESILNVSGLKAAGACGAAERFADLNDATAQCVPALPEFSVTVTTKRAIGESVVPGSSSAKGTAQATAVIKSRCSLGEIVTPSSSPSPVPTPTPSAIPVPPDPVKPGAVNFICEGVDSFKIDPLNPGSLSQLARHLFSVRLVK
ncbi:pilus assembly protein TadG-related protein [Streptomyces sp. NPDC047976]|uniref:pilus assembly protein TadG-related protein n=1 Tax=Streptomyces sp. NPDC047976 TaxID=3155746 RepID=UPI0034471D8C